MVALQIVGQKTDAALQCHQLCAPGQIFQFGPGERAVRALQKAPGVDVVELDVKIHLGEVPLILGAVVGAETDGVAEVIDGEPGHHGVQVDDTDAP